MLIFSINFEKINSLYNIDSTFMGGDMRNISTIKNGIYIILIVVPLIITPFMLDYFYYPKLMVLHAIIFVLLGTHIISKQKKSLKFDVIFLILVTYFFFVLISTFFSINPIVSIWGKMGRYEGLFTLLTFGILFLLSRDYFTYVPQLERFFIVTACVVAMYGIVQYFGVDPIPRDVIRADWTKRAFSTMGNPNFLGAYLVLILPFPIFNYLKRGNVVNLIGLSILYACLLLTFTRSSQLGFIIIVLGFFLFVLRKKHLWTRFALFTFLIVLITFTTNTVTQGGIFGRFASIGEDVQIIIGKEPDVERAGSNRVYIWLRTAELVQERAWLGYGLETLQIVFVERFHMDMAKRFNTIYFVDRAHNEWLHIAVSTGVPSLTAYLIFLVLCIRKGRIHFLNDSRYLPYVVAVLAYITQAQFNISVVSVVYVFWIFLGVITNTTVFDGTPLTS